MYSTTISSGLRQPLVEWRDCLLQPLDFDFVINVDLNLGINLDLDRDLYLDLYLDDVGEAQAAYYPYW